METDFANNWNISFSVKTFLSGTDGTFILFIISSGRSDTLTEGEGDGLSGNCLISQLQVKTRNNEKRKMKQTRQVPVQQVSLNFLDNSDKFPISGLNNNKSSSFSIPQCISG